MKGHPLSKAKSLVKNEWPYKRGSTVPLPSLASRGCCLARLEVMTMLALGTSLADIRKTNGSTVVKRSLWSSA